MNFLTRLNRQYGLRHRAEFMLLKTAYYLLCGVSPQFAWRAARLAARLGWRVGVRRKTVLRNLRIALPDRSDAELEALGRRSYEHLASMLVDFMFTRRMLSRSNFNRHISVTGWAREYLDEHGEQGLRDRARGVLFVTGHQGNWELSSGVFSLLGVSIAPVFRMPVNPWTAAFLNGLRLDSQTKLIERRGAVRQMIDHLQRGGNVGFLFDQEAVSGIPVTFFGHPASTHKTPAVLAYDYDVPIFFGVMVRKGDFLQYEARGGLLDLPEPTGDRNKDILAIMDRLAAALEVEVRDNPEQYFWPHKRWKRYGAHGEQHVRRKRK
ncbi:MAG: lysophospholipid acyltransferase family protein [Planctomycetota bacterium]|jgi:KDO2-lipid IV(A) lauroyltransferase